MLSIQDFYIFFLPLMLTTILVPHVSALSARIGGLDVPDGRKVHSTPTPLLGGIAIFCSFLFTIVFFWDLDQRIRGFLAGAICIFLTGFIDDLSNISPRQKFAGEFVAAGLVVLIGDISVKHLGTPFGMNLIELGPFAIPFTIIGIVGLINAINLLDGLDGLAGGVCMIACIAFAILAYSSQNATLLHLSIALLGALIGFIRFNYYPAKIFMGDGGSLFLGYCMGTFSVMLASEGTLPVSPYIPLLILGLPIIDTLVVIINRKRAGEHLFLPDKAHVHHRLMDLGIGHKYTVLTLIGVSYLMSMIAILGSNLAGVGISYASDTALLIFLIAIATAFCGVVHFFKSRSIGRIDLSRNRSLRSTFGYRSLVRMTGHLFLGIKYLLIAILLLPVFLSHNDIEKFSFIPLAMLILSLAVYMLRRKWGDMPLQLFLYCFSFLLIFILENYGRDDYVMGIPLVNVSHVLFFLLLLFEGIKIFVRNRTSRLIVTPFEYLILLIVMSAPLLPYAFSGRFHLMTVVAKSLILLVGLKLVMMRKISRNRKILLAIALSNLIMVVRYIAEI